MKSPCLPLFAAALVAMSPLAAQNVTIMPLGDSITFGSQGTPEDGGYRKTLDDNLFNNAGWTVTYVGTLTTNGANIIGGANHEGHSGNTIAQIDAGITGWLNSIAEPDIILLHIGTNDFGGGGSDPAAIDRLDALISKIAGLRPNAHIIVTNLLERAAPADANIVAEFNPFVEARVNAQVAAGNLVSYLDMRSLLTFPADFADNVHPNQGGYDKMAAGWEGAVLAVLDPGDGVAPALVRAKGTGAADQVYVNFNKQVEQTSAETVGNYAIDGGVTVLSAALSANGRYVTLTTSPQVGGQTYTVTVNNVQDLVAPTANTIAADSTAQFTATTPRGYFNNVAESDCYSLVYSLDLQNAANYRDSGPDYAIDNSGRIGSFDRVAYYLELQTAGGDLQYAWASMDAFTGDVGLIGVPVLSNGVTFQQGVTNLNVVSNVSGVATGEGFAGNLEFWPTNYNAANSASVPGASGSVYDFGDTPTPGGYGSMQVHNTDEAETVIAFNRWGGNAGNHDIGIGNNTGSADTDWTFMQNAGSYTVKTLQVLVRTTGDTTPPTLVSAQANFPGTNVTLQFDEPIRLETLQSSNFTLDNGVEVLGLTVGEDLSTVVLQTTCQPEATPLTLTVNNLRDTSQNANEIAPGSSIAVAAAALPASVVANIGAPAAGYELLYTLEIPVTGDLNAGNPYTVDNSAGGGLFSRVAYYMELQKGDGTVSYVWTAMDAFTGDKGQLGVPLGGATIFQQPVTNLDVISNVAGVTNITGGADGNLEFWAGNYATNNSVGVMGASNSVYDFGDERTSAVGYGCMQVHNAGAGETVLALNHFGTDGNILDVGIGNQGTSHPDWTFAANANQYAKRTLHVMILPEAAPVVPANVLLDVAEAADYELVYTLDIPSSGNLVGGSGFQDYTVNASGAGVKPFDRVAYYLELQATGDPTPTWVWVSMDAFTDDRGKVGVPTPASGAVFQQLVTNMTVASNSGAVTTGTGLDGNIEFWPQNYGRPNAAGIPGADGGAYDFGDERSTSGSYGSMQVHNYVAGETLFAINRWGTGGNTANALCVGIGNRPGSPDTDWTFANNAPSVDLLKRLHVLVRPGDAPNGGPQITGATGSTTLDRLVVSFDREVSDAAAVPGNFALDGGVTVTGATMLAGNRDIALTTSAQTPGQTYTVSVSGVLDRDPVGQVIAAGASVQFTAYTPPAVLANVPDIGMELVYHLDIPAARPRWNVNDIPYLVDEAKYGEFLFDRVAYLLELDGDWAYASFDPHTTALSKVGVPTTKVTGDDTSKAFFQTVTNMNVASNVPGVVNGTGITTGNIEFWGENYGNVNQFNIPNASGTIHDFGDRPDQGAYGTLQVHNYGESQTILAYNDWGSNSNGISDVGIGLNPTPPAQGATDWTFMSNAGDFTTRNLYVLVRPGGSANGTAPEILTDPCDREAAAGSDTTFSVQVLGDGPFRYQWRKDGTPIPGANASWLTLSGVSSGDAGAYDVVVTGPDNGAVTSGAADLTVTTASGFIVDWRGAYGFNPSDGSTPGEGDTEDKEGDKRVNLLEAAFGTNPNLADAGALSIDEGAGTFVPGDPIVSQTPGGLVVRYVRLVDHVAAGLSYAPEYGTDGNFNPDPGDPAATRVQIPDGGGGSMDLPVMDINGFDYEVVEEPFFPGNAGVGLARVRVELMD